ncbi:unnamed protein product [Rhizophagus irregularis]|nr:unnamed protein product [Rhizophagus irregularis]
MEDEDLFESEENSSEEEENEMVMLGLTSLLGTRYLEQRNFHVAKSKYWYYNILPKYDDYRFKIIMRMDSLNFQKLVLTLSTYQIFHNNSCHLQAPVEFQLAIFLRRIGSKENIFEICSRFGIAEGTIYLYCKRVMIAILSLKKTLVKWPTGEDKQYVHEGFKNIGGMENVIGAIDGSHIGLANAPLKQPETYWNRKKGNEFLLGDSAYPLSTFLIKPFTNPQISSQIQFNLIHSSHRVVVENAFGRLKNRFKALKELNSRKISNVVQLTECAIILHNFLELNNDNIEELFEDDDNEDVENDEDDRDNENEENQNEIALKREGERKREYIMNQIIDP